MQTILSDNQTPLLSPARAQSKKTAVPFCMTSPCKSFGPSGNVSGTSRRPEIRYEHFIVDKCADSSLFSSSPLLFFLDVHPITSLASA